MDIIQFIQISVFVSVCVLSGLHCISAEQSCPAGAWLSKSPDADVRFALLLSKNFNDFNEDSSKDCEMTSNALQHYLTVEWLVEKINQANNGTGYIPGITIGFDALNDCSLPEYAARNSVAFSNRYLPDTTAVCTKQETNSSLAGFVMVTNSMVAKNVATIMKDSPVPVISATATLPELSDRQLYPNFFRTVPSDVHQMTLIADMLKKLSWTYVVVAYQDNLYGNSALTALEQKAQERSICIHKSIKLPGSSFELIKEFDNVIEKVKGNTIAVVVIADIAHTQELLCSLESSSLSKIHFIMTEAVNTHIFTSCSPSSWTFSISTDAELNLNDLKTHINNLYTSEKQKGPTDKKHPAIAEYLQSNINSNVLVDGNLAPFISSTINAVFALVEAVKHLHNVSCEVPGLCESMKSKMYDDKLLELLVSNTVSYNNIKQGLPLDNLLNQDVTFTFNADSGEILPQRNLDEYTIYFLNEQKYINVGSFSNDTTELKISLIKIHSSSQTIPSSICAGNCEACVQKAKIPIVFLEGDVYIVGIFSIHESNLFECGATRDTGNDAFYAEGFIYAIRLLREKTGINFGVIGFDDCYSPSRIRAMLVDYMSNINPTSSELFSAHVPSGEILGVVGCMSSGCTLAVASFFMPLIKPVISYAASSPDLDDKNNYPYFLRTVPSDVYQAQVLVDIIKKMGWNYVGLLYVKNNYGTKGMRAVRNIVDQEGSGVCVPKEFGISENNDEAVDQDAFFNAHMYFRTLNVKVIIFFGIDERFRSFLDEMEKKNRHGHYSFLASEEWGNNNKILNAGVKSASGSITLKLQRRGFESKKSFREYLKTKRPSPDDTNIWYKEFWQNTFQCNFKGGLINEYNEECAPSLQLSDKQIDELLNDQRLTHVMNAAFAMGNALKSIADKHCNGRVKCEYLTQNPEGTVAEIMQQTIGIGDGVLDVFDENGNGAIGFDVFNIQSNDGGKTYEYVQVGTYSGSEFGSQEFDKEKLKFYDVSGNTVRRNASCTGNFCNKCNYKIPIEATTAKYVPPGEEICSDFKDSEILIISLIIVLFIAIAVTAAALFICFRGKCKAIEKKLVTNEEEIYTEPDRVVYAGPYNISAEGPKSYQDSSYRLPSSQAGTEGLSNPAYSPESDEVDSVSQVIALRRQRSPNDANINRIQTSDFMDGSNFRNLNNQHHPGPSPMLHYRGRPMPSTLIDRSRNNSEVEGHPPFSGNVSSFSQAYAFKGSQSDILQDTNNHPVSPNHISFMSQPAGVYDPNTDGVITAVPHSSSPSQAHNNSTGSDPIIYYIRDSNGQLTRLVQQDPIPAPTVRSEVPAPFAVGQYVPHTETSILKKPILKNQMSEPSLPSAYSPQHMIIMPVNAGTQLNHTAQYDDHEMTEMKMLQSPPRSHRLIYSQVQGITETPLNNSSPIHYASPVHAPVSVSTGEPVVVYQPGNRVMYLNQATGLPPGDPNKMRESNHFRQFSDPHRQQQPEEALPREEHKTMIPEDNLSRIPTRHDEYVPDIQREVEQRYLDQMHTVPDVVSNSPSQEFSPAVANPAEGYNYNPEEVLKNPEDYNPGVRYQLMSDQLQHAGTQSPISNV